MDDKELRESALLLTPAEVSALLGFTQTEGALKTAEVLGLTLVPPDVTDPLKGLETLVDRGLVLADGELRTATGQAETVALVIAAAEEWVRFGFIRGEMMDVAVAASGPAGRVLVSATRGTQYQVVPLNPQRTLADFAADSTGRFLDHYDNSTAVVNRLRAASDSTIAVRRAGQSWSVSHHVGGDVENPDFTTVAGRDEALRGVSQLWS
jgi:hypothetical protein